LMLWGTVAGFVFCCGAGLGGVACCGCWARAFVGTRSNSGEIFFCGEAGAWIMIVLNV